MTSVKLLSGGRAAHRELLATIASVDCDEHRWTEDIFTALAPLIPAVVTLGVQLTSWTSIHRAHLRTFVRGQLTMIPEETMLRDISPDELTRLFFPVTPAVTISEVSKGFGSLRRWPASFGFKDVGGVVTRPQDNRTAVLCFGLEDEYRISPREQRSFATWRSTLEAALDARAQPVRHGVFDADGRQLDGDVRHDELWPALRSGRYRLQVMRRGLAPRFVLVENHPMQHVERRLSNVETAVIEMTARGLSGKEQAWELGRSASVVSRATASATSKLGFPGVHDTIRFVCGLLRTSARLDVPRLTTSEREVLHWVSSGLSNLDIARVRGSSVRTVANQVASLLRKTGAPGRRALMPFAAAEPPHDSDDHGTRHDTLT